MENINYPMRINKYLAQKGYASRREADLLIEKKIVTINGKIAKIGDKVNENDIVNVNLKAKEKIKNYVYFAYNKPKGVVTHSPEEGQKSIQQISSFPRDVFPLGRLDKDSHGLILMTNDGRITEKLLSPEYNHEKEYVVTVNKPLNNLFFKHMANGIELEDFRTKPCKIIKINENTFRIILTEGKKHQIRRMCAALGYTILDLRRVRIMSIKLGKLITGKWRKIEGKELEEFLKSLN